MSYNTELNAESVDFTQATDSELLLILEATLGAINLRNSSRMSATDTIGYQSAMTAKRNVVINIAYQLNPLNLSIAND